MTGPAPAGAGPALEPVRVELLRIARAEARAIRDQAEHDAQKLLGQAREEAEAIARRARQQGAQEGARSARTLLTGAHRTAREVVLAAQAEAYWELRRRTLVRVHALRAGSDYPLLLHRLMARARRLLGPAAEVHEHPDGGVVAVTADGRRADYTWDALATRAVERAGVEVAGLWEP